ncbi:MAG TPA: DNA ligase D [Polyangiaceae bacterium]|jgi:bifunctional non-homologous end joining protein LigD
MATKRARRTPDKPGDRLREYRRKRDFAQTPEPEPASSQTERPAEKKTGTAGSAAKVFCVQKHDATRLHYDVRLEIDGALMSFAVPKGPSYDPQVKRLAVETEDHPMMYATFEGRIPDGEYGAGDMLLWDVGTFETVPPGEQAAQRAKGHLHVRFFGEKLRGGWHFVKTHGQVSEAKLRANGGGDGAKAQWLMFKATDETADPSRDILAERPESMKSGKIATRGPRRVGASNAGKTATALLDAAGEMTLATFVGAIDDVKAYWYEIKYDGYRLLAAKAGDEVKLRTRGGHDWTQRFLPIAQALRRLPVREAVIDGEACVVDPNGRPSFQALQAWVANGGVTPPGEEPEGSLAYAGFDLLWVDGRDLRDAPIEERRELLAGILADAPAPLSFSRASEASTREELVHVLATARAAGLEGLVAKRRGSRYIKGASGAWRKLKFERRQDCAIIGWVPLAGTSSDLGALVLAVYEAGELRYAGRVGTGFDWKTRAAITAKLAPLAIDAPAIDVPKTALTPSNARWVRPAVVCEVSYSKWSRDKSLFHPVFIALREDKEPEDCAPDREPTPSTPAPARRSSSIPASVSGAEGSSRSIPPPSAPSTLPKLANPDKVLFPRDGITKKEIYDYFVAVAPALLPHLASRPLTLQRWPDGIDGEAWYQQNAPEPLPPFVHYARFEKKKRVIADNVETIAWLANLAALTLHFWSSRVPHLDHPDHVILDLDPGDGTWKDVIDVARAVRTLLDALSLESAVKTSGKRGLHVVIPIAPGPSHAEATAFAERIAQAVAKVLPDIATTERMKEKRKGRLYIDYLQNGEGKTIVAPYAIRALDGAPVSTPIAWSEVSERLDPRAFTIRTVLDRVAKHGDLFAVAKSGRGRIV